ncbi:ComEC/Rec2 family competence protein [Gardnerella vaginalis]|uniref:ComEC/Rec2 family competence protein n=1 Tax=Gardnerella vaginalis TaxID=2702 RepID=UPI0039EEAA24
MCDDLQRVRGSRDFRMLPVAASCWVGCLLGRFCWKTYRFYGSAVILFSALAALALLAFVWILLRIFAKNVKHCANRRITTLVNLSKSMRCKLFTWNRTISLTAYVCIAACIMSYITQCVVFSDAVMRETYAETGVKTANAKSSAEKSDRVAEFTIITPLRASKSFMGDCQAVAQLHKFAGKISYVQAKFYAYSPICKRLVYGSSVRVPVTVKASRFDYDKPEIHISKSQNSLIITQNADVFHKSLTSLWQSFYNVTGKLDAQGSMLVPGVTVGMLGQEYVPTEETNSLNPIDETYATMTRNHFQHAGIMHVMAVSGGHFLLLSMLVYKCCAYLLLPRWFTSFLQIALQVLLASVVYPSASVLRALIMGIISAAAFCLKRPYQSVSALSWTVIAVLFINPSYAWDYAFALSSAATLGIVIMGVPLSKILAQYMPRWISSALSITLAAQCWTMPVQILMQPEVSFMSVPANLIVAPLMDWSTVCGLISLICASFSAGLSLIFARASSIGTGFMEQCACWCDEAAFGVFPWMQGTAGAWLMVGVEVTLFAAFMIAFRALRNRAAVQRMNIIGQLWCSSGRRMWSEASQIFEE